MGVSEYLRKGTKFTVHAADPSSLYAGSRVLQPLADSSGLPIDQLNFVVCLIVSMILAILFRLFLGRTGPIFRHLFELITGMALAYFCFGNQIVFIFIQVIVSYLIMRFAPTQYQHVAVSTFCFAYLSAAHIVRLIYDYGGYTIDVTMPLMITTQRMSSLAFSIHDGFSSMIHALPHDQKYFAVQRFPNLLELFSYNFYFHGIIMGPFVYYADYLAFIEGRNWTRFSMPNAAAIQSEEVVKNNARPSTEVPTVRIQLLHPTEGENEREVQNPLTEKQLFYSSLVAGLKSLAAALLCGVLMFVLGPMFPLTQLTDAKFHAQNSFIGKAIYMLVLIFVTKQRYYFVWKFSDAINIFSGVSYSGITIQGKALWRLTDNIDIREFELGTRFAAHINAWNKTTSNWLRFIIYDRAPWHPTLLTFLASALWHGFYPGYYLAFLTTTLFLQAVRVVRSTVRPICELHMVPRRFYELCAFLLVRLASAYMVLPFLLLTLKDTIHVYTALNWWLHLLAVAALVILPQVRRFLPESMRQKKVYGRARKEKKQQQESQSDGQDGVSQQAQLNMSMSDEFDSNGVDSDADPTKPKNE